MWTSLYRHVARPVLFSQDSETAHERTLRILNSVSRRPAACKLIESLFGAAPLPITVFGLDFPNPVGLAAGMDKHAAAIPVWEKLGFGFAELGGVTRHEQPGNPKPRMFRAVSEQALVNRMGFNNPGAEAFSKTLASWHSSGLWPAHPVGVNLGKSKVTPLEEAAGDYAFTFQRAWPYADFFVVNVSSPNTPNLRSYRTKPLWMRSSPAFSASLEH